MIAASCLSPLLLVGGSPLLLHLAAKSSGADLAVAIRVAGNGTVVYEDCYSPGSDYLLGRVSSVVSATGGVLTSNYVVRYRDRLRSRGQWTLHDSLGSTPRADVLVRRRGAPPGAPVGERLFDDARFSAFRMR
jgi:hypothetical protein